MDALCWRNIGSHVKLPSQLGSVRSPEVVRYGCPVSYPQVTSLDTFERV